MTNRELKKLSRTQLLEMLLTQSKEVTRLRAELEQLKAQLDSRQIRMEESGNIAEAALKLNGVFEAAQAAAEQYIRNIAELESETRQRCRAMEEETRRKCEAMTREEPRKELGFVEEEENWREILRLLDEPKAKDKGKA